MGWYVYIIGQVIKPNSRRGLANHRELPVAAKGQVNSSAKCKTPWHAAGRAKAKKGRSKSGNIMAMFICIRREFFAV